MPIKSGGLQIGGICLVVELHRRGSATTTGVNPSSVEGKSTFEKPLLSPSAFWLGKKVTAAQTKDWHNTIAPKEPLLLDSTLLDCIDLNCNKLIRTKLKFYETLTG